MAHSKTLSALGYFAILLLFFMEPSFQKVPKSARRLLAGVTDTEDFLRRLIRRRTDPTAPVGPGNVPVQPGSLPGESTLFDYQTGSLRPEGITEIAASTGEDSDGCRPRFVEEPIEVEQENVLLWPTCTPVKRCGGCCMQDGHECVAIDRVYRTVPVVRARYPYPGAPYFDFDGLVDTNVTDEISCICQCRIQPHHCDRLLHTYDYNECACTCNNADDSENCLAPRVWNLTTCECTCGEVRPCSNQFELFNFQTCSCEIGGGASNPGLEAVPCNRRCRPGFRALSIGGICECRHSTNWGDGVALSLGNVQQLPNPETTTTTQRPTPRPARRRPRPRQRPN